MALLGVVLCSFTRVFADSILFSGFASAFAVMRCDVMRCELMPMA